MRYRHISEPVIALILQGFIFVAAWLVWPTASIAQDVDPDVDDVIVLEEVLCKELMGQSGDDRDRSISFLHGFVLGDLGQSEFTVGDIVSVEQVFFDTCLDNPNDPALSVMKSAYGSSDE
ncbi:MAG: HdeA/HdeB family chaperone [Pseudomonadota bacterium]